ncbi:MAG: hypothetical protein GQ561_01145 [Calditrichae bacterium]|nr:hypothetical protein [Calditrichia bacterium]
MNHYFYIRKGIHLVSGYMIIWISRYDNIAIYLLGLWVLTALLLDILRNYIIRWNKLFFRIFGKYLKPAEKHGRLTGASTLWLGLYLLYLIFPKDVFYPVAFVMVFSDALAALFGKNFAFYTFPNGKTIGGSMIFIFSTVLIFRYANIPLILAFPIAILLSSVELFWRGSLENLAIGFGGALSLSILKIL